MKNNGSTKCSTERDIQDGGGVDESYTYFLQRPNRNYN